MLITLGHRTKCGSALRRPTLSILGRLLVLACALTICGQLSAQTKFIPARISIPDTGRLHQQLIGSVQRHAATVLSRQQFFIDSLALSASLTVIAAKRHLEFFVDSLIVTARDSLDAARQDSLRLVGQSLVPRLATLEPTTREYLASAFSSFGNDLRTAERRFSECKECESSTDFESRLADFQDVTDSILSVFHDTATSVADNQRDLILDAHDTVRDSLSDARDTFIDNRLADIDAWRYRSTRLVISSSYSSHNSYRGRDNGLLQQAYSPSLTFRLASGFSIQASTCWLTDTPKQWDDVQLMASYDFRFSEVVGASLSYTHFWFSDSSRSQLSVFTDNAQVGLSFDWPVVSLAALGSMNFGQASEFTFTASLSHDFVIPLNLYDQITLEPTISSLIGGQNSSLTTLRTIKLKKKAVPVTQKSVSSTFGILDYEIAFPATIEIGPITFAPCFTYIIPLNVVDASTKASFIDLDFGISLTIR